MKYSFVVMDIGDLKVGVPPLQALITIEDNCSDDNTKEWKESIHEMYEEDGYETTVLTTVEFQTRRKNGTKKS